MNRLLIASLMLATLAACSKEKAQEPAEAGQKAVAEPMAAAQTYYDGTNTAPWLALNKACKQEVAEGKRGVNCAAYQEATAQADKLIRANPSGFVGLRVKLN